jgi:hypothetical protein
MTPIPSPAEILKVSSKDPIVNACVQLWKSGQATWEQAMMLAVRTLHDHCQGLMNTAINMAMQAAPPPYLPPGLFGHPPKPPQEAPQAPAPPPAAACQHEGHVPGPMPAPSKIDPVRILHVLVSEVCTCGISHSISPEDHEEDCRGNTLIRRLRGEGP